MTKAPDTYVKVILVSSSGQEISRAKTSIKNGQPNPTYKETFSFPVGVFFIQFLLYNVIHLVDNLIQS